MRNPKRIKIFLDNVDWNKYLHNLWDMTEGECSNYIIDINLRMEELKEYWNKYPDLRMTQVLVNMGILPNMTGFWYYMEDIRALEELNLLDKD